MASTGKPWKTWPNLRLGGHAASFQQTPGGPPALRWSCPAGHAPQGPVAALGGRPALHLGAGAWLGEAQLTLGGPGETGFYVGVMGFHRVLYRFIGQAYGSSMVLHGSRWTPCESFHINIW